MQIDYMSLPIGITDSYEPEALIHRSERTETWRLRDRTDDRKYLLKVRPLTEKAITDVEEMTLKKLETHGIEAPRVVLRRDTDDRCCLIRDYVDGVTLEAYAENVGFIREEDIARIGIAILTELQPLHALPEPVIHRDIKPKNILLTNSELYRKATFSKERPPLITLIDYDTARTFKKNATNDTQFLGTLETAAPEQYGFAQSDVRTDIFGVGKTLIFLATGSYDATALETRRYSHRLKRLLYSCVSLNKDDRPDSAESMIRSLRQILKKDTIHERLCRFIPGNHAFDGSFVEMPEAHGRHRKAIVAAVIVAVAAVGVGAFFLGRMTGNGGEYDNLTLGQNESGDTWDPARTPAPTHSPGETVDFGGSKTMELAVRTALGADKDKPVTYGDLAEIDSIFAIGDQSFSDADSYRNTDNEDQLLRYTGPYENTETVTVGTGDIKDLSLLTEMPNLRRVFLSHQPVSDIEPLSWSRLEDLAIVDCPVMEYRPLSRLKNLERLVLMGCRGRDVTFLSELPALTKLCIGRMDLTSLRVLQGLPITELQFEKCFLDDGLYGVIGELPQLTKLTLWNTTEEIVKKIGGSQTLQRLEIYWTQMKDLTSIGYMPSLRDLALNCATLGSMKGIENLKPNYLFPPGSVGVDWLVDCPTIEGLEITATKNVDWAAIDRSGVKTVYVSEEQQAEIKKEYPNPSFKVELAW